LAKGRKQGQKGLDRKPGVAFVKFVSGSGAIQGKNEIVLWVVDLERVHVSKLILKPGWQMLKQNSKVGDIFLVKGEDLDKDLLVLA